MLDRQEVRYNHFLVLTTFGDHALHHLFPTLDHGLLSKLYPILFDTMKEFKVELQCDNVFQLILGNHQQMARIEPSDKFYLDDINNRKVKKN